MPHPRKLSSPRGARLARSDPEGTRALVEPRRGSVNHCAGSDRLSEFPAEIRLVIASSRHAPAGAPPSGAREGDAMQSQRSITLRRLVLALVAVGAVTSAILIADSAGAINAPAVAREAQVDLPGTICGPGTAGQPALLKTLVAAATKTETAPFQPRPMQAASGDVPTLPQPRRARLQGRHARAAGAGLRSTRACASPSRFNHAEAQRAFREAQTARSRSARCASGARRWSSARTSTCR